MVKPKSRWTPEISYEHDDDGGQLGNLPLIHVPKGEQMPPFLMIWEARDTGEIEPGSGGEEVPVVEWDMRQYAQMEILKEKLSPQEYDRVRAVLGLKPLAEATVQGQAITQKVRENLAIKEVNALGKKL